MRENEFNEFRELITDVASFYGQKLSSFALDIWWNALRRFDLRDIRHALGLHCQDPDRGQWMPKPADVVRVLEGTRQDAASLAWSKVDRAMRLVGPYRDVVFDDPIIHAVLADMGGWIALSNVAENEWPFRAQEFQKRYQGYATRGGATEWPRVMIGLANARNRREGQVTEPPVMVGDHHKAMLVYRRGADGTALPTRTIGQLLDGALKNLKAARKENAA